MKNVEDGGQFLRAILFSMLTIIAVVHTSLYFYWIAHTAYPNTLSLVVRVSSAEILSRHDSFHRLREFLRSRSEQSLGYESVSVVGHSALAPSRFELEVMYEMYPKLPSILRFDTSELQRELSQAQKGTAFISEMPLQLSTSDYEIINGEQYFIYVHR